MPHEHGETAEELHTSIEKRLREWREEFELLYILAKDDALEALEDCMYRAQFRWVK